VLIGLNLWGTTIINFVVECPDGKPVYDKVLSF
jgi:hypothetical protein